MTLIKPGSRVHTILTLLSIVGEFPYCSLHLLGDERVYRRIVLDMARSQTYCLVGTDRTITTKLVTISGRGRKRTIRIFRRAFPILEWMGELDAYLEASNNHKFSNNHYHLDRNHRVAEVAAMMIKMGMEIRQDRVPRLLGTMNRKEYIIPTFYSAKAIKEISRSELNKTCYSRIIGTIFTEDTGYSIFNVRDMVMKWNGGGETKIWVALGEIAKLNTTIELVNSTILFGESDDVALQTLLESDKSIRLQNRIDHIYRHVHFVPLSNTGLRQLRLLLIPNRRETILSMLFDDSERSFGRGDFDYDGIVDGAYVFIYFDGDLGRLIRFRDAIQHRDGCVEVICFPHQAKFLRTYLGDRVVIKTINMEVIENELGIGKEENEEE